MELVLRLMKLALDTFKNFFKFYEAEPHQEKAIEKLYEDLPDELKQDESEWVVDYRTKEEEDEEPSSGHLLPVEYYSQRDNYRDASRTCFSSSCAMALNFTKPGTISNDDEYIRTVFTIGDTTEAWVQVKALAQYGVTSEFSQSGNNQTIKDQIKKGYPVPCGILHHGRASSPSGGHWVIVIGFDDATNEWIVHDPWGYLNDVTGNYDSVNGDGVRYSYDMFDRRWTVDGTSDGWAIVIKSVTVAHQPSPVAGEELVSLTDLAYIWNCSESLIKDWEVVEMNKCLHRFDITTPERIRHFMSQTAHESGGGRYTKEISSGWDYEYRSDLGNTEPGDGPTYKGSGYLQITGRANYQSLADFLPDQDVMKGCDYVATTYPFTSGGHWWQNNRMNDLIDGGATIEQVTKRVNGGYNGLEDRKYYYQRCSDVI